jgi:hypothetical protein
LSFLCVYLIVKPSLCAIKKGCINRVDESDLIAGLVRFKEVFMSQWYLSYDGDRPGPFDHAQALAQVRKNPDGYAWREGFAEWLPIGRISDLAPQGRPLPEPPSVARPHASDEIDFRIMGSEMQFVEVELDPGESAVAEAGAMMYKDAGVVMQTVFGEGPVLGALGGLLDGDNQ